MNFKEEIALTNSLDLNKDVLNNRKEHEYNILFPSLLDLDNYGNDNNDNDYPSPCELYLQELELKNKEISVILSNKSVSLKPLGLLHKDDAFNFLISEKYLLYFVLCALVVIVVNNLLV